MKEVRGEKIILGIDPGTTITGYGLISVTGKTPSLITLGIIDLRKKTDHFQKIRAVFEETLALIDRYHPDEFAIEAPFFGKNIQSMLKLGRAQGAAISAALYRDLPVAEYAPRMIKMSITGHGQASKEQVATMLRTILAFHDKKLLLDATDALGAALCHFYQSGKPTSSTVPGGPKGSKSSKSWEEFVRNNSSRVRE